MKESTIINGWINRGHERGVVEARRADILMVAEQKFKGAPPESIRLAVEGTNDPDTLTRWLLAVIQADSYPKLAALMAENR